MTFFRKMFGAKIEPEHLVGDPDNISSSTEKTDPLPINASLNYIRRSLNKFIILTVLAFVVINWLAFKYGSNEIKIIENFEIVIESARAKMPKIGNNKWIVLTTINEPTEDVKYLASLSGWNLVVVADLKTPKNWNLEGVHFLSVEIQLDMSLAYKLARKLPYKSYTRKMIGYLYAISHGAEWIYDTDDDNRPISGGLDTFDFADERSGVRFERNQNDPLINRLFNPYLFYGRPDMWPRGFPLEYFSQHNHTDANFRLCEVQKRAAVQQGLVDMDPDVDAIFRLLHANPTKVASEHFNRHAPPIILGQKMYSPWNSQNTLFHRNAFFTMFLPTTVSFRTTDIWRSYFSQKLLHLIDEYVAFYPVNAVQIRNAHNYLKDFEDEQEIYLKSGALLKFLDEWKCSQNSTANCAIELAEQFGKMEFWQEDDVDLVKDWIHDLIEIEYSFPPLSKPTNYELPQSENIMNVNCRRMFLQLFNDKSTENNKIDNTRSIQKMENFQDFVELCDKTNVTELNHKITSHKTLAKQHQNISQLNKILDTALIIVSNHPMDLIYGYSYLQRLYSPYFGVVIFCGSWYPEEQNLKNSDVPPLQYPFNHIHINPREMSKGYNGQICLIKAYELGLRNIKGYFAVADDAMLNFWQPFNLDLVFHQTGNRFAEPGRIWWDDHHVGQIAMERALDMLKNTSKCRDYQKTIEEYQRRLLKRKMINENETAFTELNRFESWTLSDVYYIPSHEMPFFVDFMKIFYRNELFIEILFNKYLKAVEHQIPIKVRESAATDELTRRTNLIKYYNGDMTFFHSIKFSNVIKNLDERYKYCSTVVKTYHKVLFLNEDFENGLDKKIY